MIDRVTRATIGRIILGALGVLAVAAPTFATAQVTCYIRKCAVYSDGSQICERTPVDCATLPQT
jgi:hypothetical protein